MSVLVQKPTWITWLLGIFLWAASYLLYVLVMHHTVVRHNVAAAIVSALVGVTLGLYLQLRRWRKSQPQASAN